MIGMMNWLDLAMSICLYIREVVLQFLRYPSEILHTFYASQAAAHLLERTANIGPV